MHVLVMGQVMILTFELTQRLLYSAQKFITEGLLEPGKKMAPWPKKLPKKKKKGQHIEDPAQCRSDKSQTALGQTTDISPRTTFLLF